MKVVVLSGSPHKNGTTAKLLESFIKGAEAAGNDVVRFDTAFMDVHPCIACDKCRTSQKAACVYEDDMVKIGNELATADYIAFVTPIYYYGLCTQLKTVIDRFYAIDRKIRNGQKTVFISAMADDRPETVLPANDSYRAIVNWMEWTDAGIVNALNCSNASDLEGTNYEEEAYKLGNNIK